MKQLGMTPVSKAEIHLVNFRSVMKRAVQQADNDRQIIVVVNPEGAGYGITENTPLDVLVPIEELFVEVRACVSEDPYHLACHLATRELTREGQHEIS